MVQQLIDLINEAVHAEAADWAHDTYQELMGSREPGVSADAEAGRTFQAVVRRISRGPFWVVVYAATAYDGKEYLHGEFCDTEARADSVVERQYRAAEFVRTFDENDAF